jgi:hypothetical protein
MVLYFVKLSNTRGKEDYMPNWWLAVGRPEHWQIAFEYGSIWGLKATSRQTALWERLSQDDYVLFYATSPVSGVIGYGVVRTKFRQDKPLWPREVEENKVIWPYRFEFDVKYCLPQDRWKTHKVVSDVVKALARGGFQAISEELANETINLLVPELPKPKVVEKKPISLHDEIKAKLLEIGRLQRLIVDSEYDMDGGRLDVVWRRIERAVPAYVFEVQIGGDLYHALGKLKHAFDLWNSNIFLVVAEEDVHKARGLLSGTFHEIQGKVKLVEVRKIDELFRRKKAYRDFEAELGIL